MKAGKYVLGIILYSSSRKEKHWKTAAGYETEAYVCEKLLYDTCVLVRVEQSDY